MQASIAAVMKMPRIALGQISGRDETAISPAGAITMHVFSLTLFDRRKYLQ